MTVVELRAVDGRATVAGRPATAGPLPAALADDLHEWARVVAALGVSGVPPAVVSRRGRQLAARVSVALGAPVDYCDPVSRQRVALRAVTRTPRVPPVPPLPPTARRAPRARADAGREPTPWGTGLALAVLTAGLVLLANLALAGPMVASLGGLGVLLNVMVAAGLAPALWLNRRVPTWRWAVWGTFAGMALAVPVLWASPT